MRIRRRITFRRYVEDEAWARQRGRCAACGKPLVYYNRGWGGRGAYQPHHLRPRVYGGDDSVDNCVLLCIGVEDCHLHVGHGGNFRNYIVLHEEDLTYMYVGRQSGDTT